MNKLKSFIIKNKINILFYLLGFIVLGFAVNIMKASTLGNGAWDTVTINIRDYLNLNLNLEWVTLGMISLAVSITLMTIVFAYRKNIKFLLMIVPIFLVASSIDFWNIVVFQEWEATKIGIQIVLYIIGTLLLPLGLTLIVKSSFPAFVFDELMLMFVKIFKAKKITYVRLGIEFIGLSIGAIFGFLTYYHLNGTFGAVDIGSFILTFTISPIMAFYYKALKVQRTD
ncbi:MAG: hypothetical protein KAH13_03890 [Tenericutes bacterium]|nr:hypothetical protein [Mycoplasmatota bacterium]